MSHLKDTWVENEVFHASDLNEIARTVNGILNDEVASYESTYSSAKLVEMIADVGFATRFVEELPEIGDRNTIYFVPSTGGTQHEADGSDEYMWIDDRWELLGSTKIDFSDYYTKEEINELLIQIEEEINGKANIEHTHEMSEVNGLESALAGKSNTGHTHDIGAVNGLSSALAGKSNTGHTHGISDVDGLNSALAGKSNTGHTHGISDVDGLNNALAGKSNTGHTHNMSEVDGLNSALQGKANANHTHGMSDVEGLDSALEGKANAEHTHEMGEVNGLDSALQGKADTGHTHEMNDVNGLTSALEGKSDTGHTHGMSEVTGLENALEGKSDKGHTHTAQEVGAAPVNHTHNMSTLVNDCHYAKIARVSQEEYDEMVSGGTLDEDTIYMITGHTPTAVTATFINYDDTVLQTTTVPIGETPEYTGSTPTRPNEVISGVEYEFTFTGWTPSITAITADTIYTASYSAEVVTNTYIITFENYDGTVLQQTEVEGGETPVYEGQEPERDDDYDPELNIGTGYTFNGWSPALEPATADTVYTAVYQESLYEIKTVNRFNRLRTESDFDPEKRYVLCASPDDFVDHSVSMWISAGFSGGTAQIYNYANTTLHDVEAGWDSVESFDADEETMSELPGFIELTPEEEGSIRLIWYNDEPNNYLYLGTNTSSNKFVSSDMQVDTNQYRWVLDYDENDDYHNIRGIGRSGSCIRFNPGSPRFSVYTGITGHMAYLFAYEPFEEKVPLNSGASNGTTSTTRRRAKSKVYKPYTSDTKVFVVTDEEPNDENNTPKEQMR